MQASDTVYKMVTVRARIQADSDRHTLQFIHVLQLRACIS